MIIEDKENISKQRYSNFNIHVANVWFLDAFLRRMKRNQNHITHHYIDYYIVEFSNEFMLTSFTGTFENHEYS